MGLAVEDVDGDGDFDVLRTNFDLEPLCLHLNDGRGYFTDQAQERGLAAPSMDRLGWGCGLVDVDCDGDLDLLVANGHVMPQAEQIGMHAWAQRSQLFEALEDQRLGVVWRDVSDDAGPGLAPLRSARGIAFGYESSSRRVLDRMCKGIDPEASLDLVRRVRAAGISVTLYVMIGFPTETREEAQETLRTVLAQRDLIQEVSVRVFYLDERSELFGRREEFDIVEIYPDPEADLQVYYDFRTSSGMTRRESRDVYLEFTQALRSHFPVFQNTNMLYHELKGHYFLYLVKHGTWERLLSEVLERPDSRSDYRLDSKARAQNGARQPRARGELVTLPLRFDRSSIDARLADVDSRALRPRYQSDLIDGEDRGRLDREVPAEMPSESFLVYDPRTGEVQCLSAGAELLRQRCDGSRTLEEIVEIVPAEVRRDATRCVEEMLQAGLLEAEQVTT
jgi:hypothetical protein